MRKYYHAKRDTLLSLIKNSPLSSYAEIAEEDAGLHFLLKLKTTLSDHAFCLKAEQKGVKLKPLSDYYMDEKEQTEHIFVINYSSVETEVMKEAIQKIYEIVKIA